MRDFRFFAAVMLGLGLGWLSPLCVQAQLPNQRLSEDWRIPAAHNRRVFLNFYTLGYLRNNEYFNPIVLGETIFGYAALPSIAFYPSERVKLEGGIFIQRDFGSDLVSTRPFFRIQYQKDSLSVVFGNLYANYAHALIEPLYGFEQGLRRQLEDGIQIRHKGKRHAAEVWVDWVSRKENNETTVQQEEIWGGLAGYVAPFKSKQFEMQVPVQVSILHRGGQGLRFDVARPATNALNAAIGLNFHWHTPNSFIRKVRWENYWLAAQMPDLRLYPAAGRFVERDQVGSALYLNLALEMRPLEVMLSWWQANNYNSALGGDLYKSFSQYNSSLSEPKRNILLIRAMRDFKIIDQMYFTLRAEPYYDFENSLFEYSYGFYITYRPSFELFEWKKRR